MASLDSYLPSDGSAVWARERKTEVGIDSQTVRHVVIRATELLSEPSPHIVYRIDVLTEHSHWYICRRYSEFHDLHRKLVRRYKINKELLPPKKLSGNFSRELIKLRKQQLEQYLQKLINSEVHVSQATELLSFLDAPSHDVVRVAELLARQLYSIGDKLLDQGTPIALTINDLHCVTRRLRLPMDLQRSSDPSADLGHLYSFLHQIVSLKVIPPPPPSSVTRMAFEITHFKTLEILKIENVPLTQVSGMARVQQQLKKLSIHYTLKSLRELLIDCVEEKRTGGEIKQLTDSWRLVATAKFTSNRVVIQPWNNLVTLNISHNKITCLDDSLQVLPALKEINASYNLLVHLDLQHVCLPFLKIINLSHNHITTVNSRRLVIESVTNLNMSNNGLFDLSFLPAFVGVEILNLIENRITSKRELDYVSYLKSLEAVQLKGNPIMTTGAARIILMAKFIQKSKMVVIDGSEPTNGEQARIRQQLKRHGTDIDKWPVAQSIKTLSTTPTKYKTQEDSHYSPVPPSPPSVHVSWTIESLKKPFRSNDPSPSQSVTSEGSFDTFDNPLFSDSPISPIHGLKHPSLLSRDEPDGRSDISNDASDIFVSASSPLILPTPPCTPLSIGGDDSQVTYSNVTPQMISAALEALSTSLSSTPNEDNNQLPDILTQALNDFISGNSSKCTTPPSTPQDQDEYITGYSISAGDLISAITSTLSAHCELNRSSENLQAMSSGAPSVPFGTPREGGLLELSRLIIQPESLLAALNKLRSNKDDELVEVQEEYSTQLCDMIVNDGDEEIIDNKSVTSLDNGCDTIKDEEFVISEHVLIERLPDEIEVDDEKPVEPVEKEINDCIAEDETKLADHSKTDEIIATHDTKELPITVSSSSINCDDDIDNEIIIEELNEEKEIICEDNTDQPAAEEYDSSKYSRNESNQTSDNSTNDDDNDLCHVSSDDSLPKQDECIDHDTSGITRGPKHVSGDINDFDCSHSDNDSDKKQLCDTSTEESLNT